MKSTFLQKKLEIPSVSTTNILVVTVVWLIVSFCATVWLANDPDWARWHISYLGEGDKFSAHFFNISMWLAALLVFWLSWSVRKDLNLLKKSDKKFENVKPRIIQLGLIVMAICVYLVGLFPRSFGILPHDIFGHAIYFTFLALCMASPWLLPGLPKWFYAVSYGFHLAMLLLFISYWTGINDSLYVAEVATFIFFLGWLAMLIRQSKRVTSA